MSDAKLPRPSTPSLSLVAVLCLLVAIVLTLSIIIYPPLLSGREGHLDHGVVLAVLWSMSAGYVRGVGFIPNTWIWRWLFSGWAVCIGVALAVWQYSYTGG